MITRRQFLAGLASVVAGGAALSAYAAGIEPFRLRVQRHRITPPGWTPGVPLRIAALADLHACAPWMTADRLRHVVAETMTLAPDIVVLLGDYIAGHRFVTDKVPAAAWAGALGGLEAPLGVHAILGNHDWWEDAEAQRQGHGPVEARRALEAAGVAVYENRSVRLEKDGQGFWLAGLADQLALWSGTGWRGIDDLPGTLAQVTDDAPVILLAHEPDIFPDVPARVSLTLSGHTHGGQVRLFGWSPVVPSRFGNRYAYGHIVEQRPDGPRHLVVSGGLGCSILPVRLGVVPEITLLELGG